MSMAQVRAYQGPSISPIYGLVQDIPPASPAVGHHRFGIGRGLSRMACRTRCTFACATEDCRRRAAGCCPWHTAKLPAPITSIPNTPNLRLPGADVQPLFGAIEDGAMAAANLTTCRADLADEKQIAAKDESIIADQNKQLGLKDD